MQKISVRVKYNGFESIHIHPRRTQNDVYRRFCYAFFSPCCSGTFICVFIEQPINFENKKLYIFFLFFSSYVFPIKIGIERDCNEHPNDFCVYAQESWGREWMTRIGVNWTHRHTHNAERESIFNIRDFQSICQLEKRQMEIKKIASTIWLGFAVLPCAYSHTLLVRSEWV